MGVVLMADPRVTAIEVIDNGDVLVDARDSDLAVSSYRADSTGAFAHVRAEVMDRPL
jgi:D-alanyl-D-alanine dipeptidase